MPAPSADAPWLKLEDPISLEPLRRLRFPPFRCPADPELRHGTDSDWFDGGVLASYLVCEGALVWKNILGKRRKKGESFEEK